jgi:hypothetical protein
MVFPPFGHRQIGSPPAPRIHDWTYRACSVPTANRLVAAVPQPPELPSSGISAARAGAPDHRNRCVFECNCRLSVGSASRTLRLPPNLAGLLMCASDAGPGMGCALRARCIGNQVDTKGSNGPASSRSSFWQEVVVVVQRAQAVHHVDRVGCSRYLCGCAARNAFRPRGADLHPRLRLRTPSLAAHRTRHPRVFARLARLRLVGGRGVRPLRFRSCSPRRRLPRRPPLNQRLSSCRVRPARWRGLDLIAVAFESKRRT